MNRRLLCAMAVLLIGCGLGHAGEPSAADKSDKEFAGKIVIVSLTGAHASAVLENVKVITLGGESFLAGTGIKRTEAEMQKNPQLRAEWSQGSPVRVNLRSVLAYVLLSPDQWKAMRERFVSGTAPAGTP